MPNLEQYGITQSVLIAAAAVVAVLMLVIVVLIMRRGKQAEQKAPELSLDLRAAGEAGPASGGPHLEVYNIPVRLAIVVLAPVGRDNTLPSFEKLPKLLDQLLPGFEQILSADRPQIVRWPAQLSSQGFSHTFFGNLRLPGDKGKGTPWCAVAGRFEADGKHVLVGLALRSAAPNSLAQMLVEHQGKWLDVLRVRG